LGFAFAFAFVLAALLSSAAGAAGFAAALPLAAFGADLPEVLVSATSAADLELFVGDFFFVVLALAMVFLTKWSMPDVAAARKAGASSAEFQFNYRRGAVRG
jgi:hypothetical protein